MEMRLPQATEGGARRMARELQAQGYDARVEGTVVIVTDTKADKGDEEKNG
jgi:hypothetical protein